MLLSKDPGLHTGMVYFVEPALYDAYVAANASDADVSTSVFELIYILTQEHSSPPAAPSKLSSNKKPAVPMDSDAQA